MTGSFISHHDGGQNVHLKDICVSYLEMKSQAVVIIEDAHSQRLRKTT